jgi:hypothetical protein
VASQRDAAFEAEEEVLAGGLDRLEPPAVEPRRDVLHGRAWIRRLHGEPLADEHAQALRGAVDRVSLGHTTT